MDNDRSHRDLVIVIDDPGQLHGGRDEGEFSYNIPEWYHLLHSAKYTRLKRFICPVQAIAT